MFGTVSVDINNFDIANADYALVEYINREDSSFSSLVTYDSTSYHGEKSIPLDSKKSRKLSSLSGLFDFQKLDEEYFKEKGI